MNDRQRIILGLVMVIAVAGAGVLSLVYTRGGASIKADVPSSTSDSSTATNAYIKLNDGLEAYINNQDSCTNPGQSTVWRIYIKNGTGQSRSVTMQFTASGLYGLSLPNGAEEWTVTDSRSSTRVTLGQMTDGQSIETTVSAKTKAPKAAITVLIDDGSGIVFPGEIIKSISVSEDCQI